MEVLGKDLVDGVFYHASSGHLDFVDVWYKNGRSLINPRNKDHGHCIDVVWAYYPLTVEDVDAFTDWMARNGDEAGIKAWDEYKGKLIKGAEMAKNNKDVDLYNPEFVHFEWSEDLRGKKGFRADDIGMLKSIIRDIGIADMGTLIGFKNEAAPFIVKLPREDCYSYWQFFYYDPNYEVKWAFYKEGKELQYRLIGDEEWEDMVKVYDYYQAKELGPVYFDTNDRFEFRIKPEEPKPEVEVNVDVKVNNTSSDNKIKITINGKECVFENAEQARMVLKG